MAMRGGNIDKYGYYFGMFIIIVLAIFVIWGIIAVITTSMDGRADNIDTHTAP